MTGTLTAHPLTPPSRRVGWCVLAALGLHAALGVGLFLRTQALAPGQTPGHTPGYSATTSGGHAPSASTATTATAMQVRWTLATPTRIAQADTAPALAPPMAQPSAERTDMADAAEPFQALAPMPATSAEVSPAASPSADGDATFTGYARRDMLDRPPQALGIVQISYPPGVEPGRVRTGRLTLFIDEAGAVRKVMVAPPPNAEDALPAPFVEAAREAFLQARFTPGERQGMPVKSRIDVEVSFDDRETAPVETAQQPTAPAGTDRSV
ncbi:hypothetical protein [Aquabacterium sp.]|jgi:periplasmic protein TonB|uniref:hypothetical protein n=1 Tax=Aquabacterium sp. TaxID=1872578 RepID=UPI0024881B73|nr:hypothetical protein [Aquabacterium sp.]MDI1349241.1 hypothetical protein [Aquabacterium sp.]